MRSIQLIVAGLMVSLLGACQLKPHAVADQAVTNRGTPIDIRVLDNDTDPRDRVIHVVNVTSSLRGTALVNPDNTIRYVPNADTIGEDAFTYKIQNTRGRTSTAEVVVTIAEPSQAIGAAPASGVAPAPLRAEPVPNPDMTIATPSVRAVPAAGPAATPTPVPGPAPAPAATPPTNTPSPVPLPAPSANATIQGLAVTFFTREDDKNAGETIQLSIKRGEEVLMQKSLSTEAWPRQTDRVEEIKFDAPIPGADAAKLSIEVRKIAGVGAGESWIMQIDVLGRLSDGRTVSLVPKSLPFRFGGGSSNNRTWTFQAIPAGR